MLIKIYDSTGNGYPLVDVKDGHVEHNESGQDKLYFKLNVGHEMYPLIVEEARIDYGGNKWLVKKIQDDAVECEIDFDFLKETVKHNYSYSNQLLSRVLADNLPVGWTIIGANNSTVHRGRTYDHCTPFEVIQECITKYDVRFIWQTLTKTLTVRVPNKITTSGVYLSDQLNLKSLTFQGSTQDFATRLYAYGKEGVTFAAINGGKEYIEDKAYSSKTICAYWVDERYEIPTSLLSAAYEKLAAMAKPERSYECKVKDLEKENSEYSHLALRMHDKVSLMVSERNLRVLYSIVKYDEYPDDPNNNTVTLSSVPGTIQGYTEALVKASVESALVVAEQALTKSKGNEEEIKSIEETLETVEGTVESVSEKANDAFNRSETAMLEAQNAEMNVRDVIKGMAVSDDAYYCGDKSPTFGRTYQNAVEVMVDGIVYIPTTAHAEFFEEIEEHGEIYCGTPADRAEPERTHDAGSPASNREGVETLYAGTPTERLQFYGANFYFYIGKAYIWQNGGWELLKDVAIDGEYFVGDVDGALWLCTMTHSSSGVEYQKDTVYRWTVKDDSDGGLWSAITNKTGSFVNKSINSLIESVVSITTEITEQAANIQLLSAWRATATQSIASLEITTNANSADISTLLSFMGSSESGAIKAIASLESEVNAHEASIENLVAWMGNTESGAIKAIADVTQKANANEASIGTIVSWIGDSNSGAIKAIADVTATANANSASITALTNWRGEAAESITALQQSSSTQEATITALSQRVTDTETNIASVELKANDNASSILSITQTVSQHSENIATINQTTTAQQAEIVTLVERANDNETDIAQVRQAADENGASITAIVTNDKKALALSREKYVVGRKAPTYGYDYDFARGIMEAGTMYVPSVTHSETYTSDEVDTIYSAGTPETNRSDATIRASGFEDRYTANIINCGTSVQRARTGGAEIQYELGFCYRWNGDGWVKIKPVSLYTEETGGEDDELWYCQLDIIETDEETEATRIKYSAGTLYCWAGANWVAVADIGKNYAQMAAATIEVKVNSITARVTVSEGHIASLALRTTNTETSISAMAQWKSNVEGDVSNIATISAKANANESAIALKADKTAALSHADVHYALSTSATVAPTTGWNTSAPAWESGKFMWQKTILTYADGSTTESAATCLTGATGADGTSVTILGSYNSLAELQAAHPTGADGDGYLVTGHLYVWNGTEWQDVGVIQGPAGATGTGIASIIEQYYLSDSNITQTGGSWQTTSPVWVSGKYIWTRSYIEWTDSTISTTAPTLAQAINSFGASIKLNTSNIELKVSKDSVISTINQSAEEVAISASKINITGVITAINGGTTTIDGDKITSETITATQIDATNLHVSAANIDGTITAGAITVKNTSNLVIFEASGNTVSIGSFIVGRNYSNSYIYSGKTSIDANAETGVYIGTNGIAVGGASNGSGGNYNVTINGNTGKLTANNAEITGKIAATSGSIENLSITGKLYFGAYTTYYISANNNDTDYFINLKNFKVDATDAYFSGRLNAPSGEIGGFTITNTNLYKSQTTYNGSAEGDTAGVYVGTNGIGLGAGRFYVTSAGALHATGANISGTIYASAGTIANLSVTGKLFFGNNSMYYIDANYDNLTYYIYLKNFRVNDTAAYFSGNLEAPSGTIGGFTIGSTAIYKTKTAYNDTTAGVYIGTNGIGLGAGTFHVSSAGALFSTSGTIGGFTIDATKIYKNQTSYNGGTAGVYLGTDGIGLGAGSFYVTSAGALTCSNITATGGSIQNLTITGRLYFGGDSTYYIDANYNNYSWYIYLPKFRADLNNAIFSGNLSAPTGSIGGFTIDTSRLYNRQTSYNGGSAGVYIGTDGIGLGAGKFYVTSAGALYATNATITGVISNVSTAGWGVKIIDNRIEFNQSGIKRSEMYATSGYYRANGYSTANSLYISSQVNIGGDLVCGGPLGISTGNGIYVSSKLALTSGQIKVQTDATKTRYLLFYCGILVGVSANKYDGITDYSQGSY